MSELLTTDSVDRGDRLDYWREVICAVYVELDAEPVADDSFSGSVELTSWGEMTLSRVASEGQVVTRKLDRPQSDCLLSLQLAGTGRVTQGGRTALLQPGDFALYDATERYQLAFDGSFTQMVVQFPRQALIARNVDIAAAVASRCSGRQGIGAVVASFVNTLRHHEAEIPAEERHRLGQQAVDLAAVALADAGRTTPTGESLRQFDRQRVLDHAGRHLDDPGLSVTSIADAFGVSTRTIQKLFADDEVQLAARIRLARIDRAKRALSDPLRHHHTIARISQDLGFGSSQQFARVFRAAVGCSPREFRVGTRPGGTRGCDGPRSRPAGPGN